LEFECLETTSYNYTKDCAVMASQRPLPPQTISGGTNNTINNFGDNCNYTRGGDGGPGVSGGSVGNRDAGESGGLQVVGGEGNVSTEISESKEVILVALMPSEMQQAAVNCAKKALGKYKNLETDQKLKEVANYIRTEFDMTFKPYWNCIVGPKFSSYVHHNNDFYIKFELGENRFVIFKTP